MVKTRLVDSILPAVFLLPTAWALCQTKVPEPRHLPRLQEAALPHYPAIAEAAHITGDVVAIVKVRGGRVVSTQAPTGSKDASPAIIRYLQPATLQNIQTWRFGADVNDTFSVMYSYEIAGERSDEPTNPHVEMLPNLNVKITARPVKLTCSDGPCPQE